MRKTRELVVMRVKAFVVLEAMLPSTFAYFQCSTDSNYAGIAPKNSVLSLLLALS
jgi:hypothetical protein